MATCFDRWEKDPFFLAAEEVQDSTDRLESVYRRWIHERKVASTPENADVEISGDLVRELQTALGTAKWQLDELNRAVRTNDDACSAGEETRTRHNQFVESIGNQISTVENSLRESNYGGEQNEHSWVKLDQGERDELAVFLTCDSSQPDFSKRSGRLNETSKREVKEEKAPGHHRSASASADMESWHITVNDDQMPGRPLHKISSLSHLQNDSESTSKAKWSKNVIRKLRGGGQYQQDHLETIPLRNTQLSRGCNACYEKTKSCLSSCGHDGYDKQLYGWFGTLQRQLQRSQYHIQYGRPVQMTLLAVLVVLLIGSKLLMMKDCKVKTSYNQASSLSCGPCYLGELQQQHTFDRWQMRNSAPLFSKWLELWNKLAASIRNLEHI